MVGKERHAAEVQFMSTRLQAVPATASQLSRVQLEHQRRRLVQEHLLQQTRAIELQDPLDLEPDLAALLLTRRGEALAEIEEAALIGRGDYGTCSGCRSAIPYERLEVVPAAQRCVSCQAGRDRVPR
jgi:RNA polymerase-binding transcription factor DksA